ncbi:PAS domain S-box protein [Ensifer adhaerens]|uniref:PAS domain S-box protein n=1 Tax=Ensifer adhaerens TaxID=106592 RepID=UPI003CF62B41
MQAREERLRAIFSQSAAGIVQTDLAGRFLLVNNRFCEILGRSECELLSMRTRGICVSGDIAEAERLFKNDG